MSSRSILADERGVATVMVALAIPLFLLFCVFAVDVANWFVHKRHLQTQADAAAMAGAGVFTFPTCNNNLIRNTALQYSGKGDGMFTWNDPAEVKTEQSRLFAEINEKNFHNQSKPGDADLPAEPCDTKVVDVKMTETNLPWFFGTGLVPNINAEARVQLFKATEAERLLPIGVQEAAPEAVRAFLVDEADGTEIPNASVELTPHGSNAGLQIFANDTALALPVPAGTPARIGVRLAVSGNAATTTCGQPLVACYDSLQTSRGLSFIRTWAELPATLASPAAPVAGSVFVEPGSCPNGSFNSNTTSCAIKVSAKVRWNSDVTAAHLDPATSRTKLTARFAGGSYPMQYDSATATWTTTAGLPIAPGTIGSRQIDIDWEQQAGSVGANTCSTSNGNKCKGTFANVQRTYWNNPDDQGSQAGPVARFDVTDAGGVQLSDMPRCDTCTASLLFEVGFKGALELSAAADAPVSLRVSANQSQSLQCDPAMGGANGLIDMLAAGCAPRYRINTGQACPQAKNDLWATAQPWPCVAIQTGEPPNATPRGLNRRILCNAAIDGPAGPANCNANDSAAVCTHPNKWPITEPGDPRLVDVFVTPFGTFSGSGQETVPIIKIGRFYITGYTAQGGGVNTPCAGLTGPDADDYSVNPPPAGNISGHFIKGVDPNAGGGGTETCDFTEVGNCVAVLVK